MSKQKHISEAKKQAATLQHTDLINDTYHNNIKNAAIQLCKEGNGSYRYGGQYSSGNTFWYRPDHTTRSVERIIRTKTKDWCHYCDAPARFIQGDRYDRSELIYLCDSCNDAFNAGWDHYHGHDMKEFILEDFNHDLWTKETL